MLKSRRLWLGLIITLVFLGLLFYRTKPGEIIAPLRSANYFWVLPAVAVYFVGFWFKVMRWAYILRSLKPVSSRKLFSLTVIGYAVNNLLPFRIGELVRAYMVGEKEGISKSAAVGTIIVERIFDGLALVFMVVVIFLLLPPQTLSMLSPESYEWLKRLTIIMSIMFAGFLGGFIFLAASPHWTQRILDWIACCLPKRFGSRLQGLGISFITGIKILHSPMRLLVVFGYSLILWTIEAAMSWILSFTFNMHQAFPAFFVGTATGNLATTLPTTQGGIGPFEYFYKQSLIIFGTPDTLATTYAVVLHVVLLVPLIVLGLVFIWTSRLSFSQLARRSLEVKTSAATPDK